MKGQRARSKSGCRAQTAAWKYEGRKFNDEVKPARRAGSFKIHHSYFLFSLIAGPHKFADDVNFRHAVDGVFLGKLVPGNIQSGGLQLSDLFLGFGERQQRIVWMFSRPTA